MLDEPTIGKTKQDLDPTSTSKRKKARRGAERKQQLVNGAGSRAVESAQDETATATTDGEFSPRTKVIHSLCMSGCFHASSGPTEDIIHAC